MLMDVADDFVNQDRLRQGLGAVCSHIAPFQCPGVIAFIIWELTGTQKALQSQYNVVSRAQPNRFRYMAHVSSRFGQMKGLRPS